MLSCPVRGCARALERAGRALVCPAGHTFDVARSGYVNLLQPQDRRSAEPGDRRAAVEARERLFAAGLGAGLVRALEAALSARATERPPVVADVGSGTGDVLGALARERVLEGYGVELSTFAAERAARRFPGLSWLVANAHRRLPFADRSVDLLLSVHGPRNAAEFARVLAPDGVLWVAVPAEDDLIELRARVQGEGQRIDRSAELLRELEPHFELRERTAVRERRVLERALLLDLLAATYRGARRSASPAVEALDELEVTLASECFVFSARS